MMSTKKKLLIAVALIIAGTLAALLVVTPQAPPEVPLPNPNGYDDFIKAGGLISSTIPNWTDLSSDGWHALVASNMSALELVQAGLQKQCRVVPCDLTSISNNHMNDLASLKRTAQAFAAASRLALADGHTNEAATLALDCMRFGQESARGGVLIHGLVGLAIQAIGRTRLEEALPGMDAKTSRKVLDGLKELVDKREVPAEVWKSEGQWARRGRFGQVNFIMILATPFLQRDMRKKTDQKFAKGFSELQQSTVHAAAHAYEVDHGKPPAAPRELVPGYLKTIPIDATTGKEIPLN